MAKSRERRAVLVLPDIGLDERQMEKLKEEFQSNLVSTLRNNTQTADVEVVVTVTITF